MQGIGLSFEVRPSHVDESVSPDLAPHEVVESLALRKAQAVAEELAGSKWMGGESAIPDARAAEKAVELPLVIGGDTVVVLGDAILGKPKDDNHAFQMLSDLQGRTHRVYSGLCIVDLATGATSVAHSKTQVTMRPLDEMQVRRYIATGEPRDKAGAYAIQGYGATLVTEIAGDYFTVVGMPLALLSDLLARHSVHVL